MVCMCARAGEWEWEWGVGGTSGRRRVLEEGGHMGDGVRKSCKNFVVKACQINNSNKKNNRITYHQIKFS